MLVLLTISRYSLPRTISADYFTQLSLPDVVERHQRRPTFENHNRRDERNCLIELEGEREYICRSNSESLREIVNMQLTDRKRFFSVAPVILLKNNSISVFDLLLFDKLIYNYNLFGIGEVISSL